MITGITTVLLVAVFAYSSHGPAGVRAVCVVPTTGMVLPNQCKMADDCSEMRCSERAPGMPGFDFVVNLNTCGDVDIGYSIEVGGRVV